MHMNNETIGEQIESTTVQICLGIINIHSTKRAFSSVKFELVINDKLFHLQNFQLAVPREVLGLAKKSASWRNRKEVKSF